VLIVDTEQHPVDAQAAREIQRRIDELQAVVEFDVAQALEATGVSIVCGSFSSMMGGYLDRRRRLYLDPSAGYECFAHELGHWLYWRGQAYRHPRYPALIDRAVSTITPVLAFEWTADELKTLAPIFKQARSRREAWARLFEQAIALRLARRGTVTPLCVWPFRALAKGPAFWSSAVWERERLEPETNEILKDLGQRLRGREQQNERFDSDNTTD